MQNKTITERKHRLSKKLYRGKIYAAFTLCIQDGLSPFSDSSIVNAFTDILRSETGRANCVVPAYCFMPDHQHLILSGTGDGADLWKAVVAYKQKTGYWLSRNRPNVKWQKDFYDHVIRSEKTVATQVRYVLDNPVRKGLVASWQEHPYKGAIGCSLDDVLNSIV